VSDRRSRSVLAIALAAAMATACTGSSSSDPTTTAPPTTANTPDGELPPDVATLTTAGGDEVEVHVEVADSPDERATGLMDRPSLPDDQGMVFLWEEPTEGSFWMKDTLIPLSVGFWGEDGRILAILDMQPCEADPCPVYDPEVAFVGAIEVNQGFFEEHGIERGDHIELTRA
jgi:uncharacterized membrane protein (UPF0127 family)